MINQANGSETPKQTRFEVQGICSLLWLFFAAALTAVFWNWTHGPTNILLFKTIIQETTLSFGFRIDALSTTMLAMTTLLGALIGHYSVRYLAGEKRQTYFFRYLLLVLISASLLVASNNLILFFVAWLGSSLSLHKLLIYYERRPQAVTAARKKFIISRLGDLFLLLAIGLTYQTFSTFEFQELFEKASHVLDSADQSKSIGLIGFFFALGAMAKSAQFPFHFWLPETMESPTPVSALMHAGIINAGGFLIIRLSPILQHANAAHILLAGVGSFTAVFAALVMITQNHLKGKLAYSTISQMGMMLFACGLGAYSLAIFHIVAHSFYKAYAFLSTGMQVEESKRVRLPQVRPSKLFLGCVTVIGFAVVYCGLIYQQGVYLPYYTYCAIILLGVFQNIGSLSMRMASSLLFSRIGFTLVASIFLFLFIEYNLNLHLSSLVPNIHISLRWYSPQALLCLFSYFVFASGLWLSAHLPQAKGTFMKRVYCYFWNGGYFTAYSSVLLERFFGKSQIEKRTSTQIPATEHANV